MSLTFPDAPRINVRAGFYSFVGTILMLLMVQAPFI